MKAERSAGTYRIPGLSITDHEFSLPLDHAQPQRGTIGVFAREIADIEGQDRPFLVFFQGGPGHEAPRPLSAEEPRWLKRALRDYRVLMLDQRGTGRSTPVGRLPGMSPGQQAQYLKFFRADSIVRDAEHVRRELGVDRWSVLGQSFGGFCVVTYLSLAPAAIAEAFVTGGLPPIATPIDDIYRATYRRVIQRNHRFYERYAADRARVQAIHRHLDETGLTLPSGDRLTSRRFRQLGQMLGMSDGAEKLHYIVELPVDSPAFAHDVEAALPFSRNPLYAILHEACYGDGFRSDWSAQRVLPPEFEDTDLFTGEMVYPWMFEEYAALRDLREAAIILAQEAWQPLYDADCLRRNTVPAAAIIYTEDMYVERAFSEETASIIRGLRPWITSEYEHNGLRADGERILDKLSGLVHDPI